MPEPTSLIGVDPSEEWSAYRTLLIARIAVFVTALGAVAALALFVDVSAEVWLVVVLVTVDLLLSVPYYRWGRRWPSRLRSLTLAIIFVEIVFVTAGLYLLGPKSDLLGLSIYGYIVVGAAALHSQRAAFVAALTGTTAYTLMATATTLRWLPMRSGIFPFTYGESWPLNAVLVVLMTGLVLALLAGSLSEASRGALARSREFELQLLDLNRSLEERIDRSSTALRAANQTLEWKNESLAQTLRRVDLFARAVSHDVRNPVTAAGESIRLALAGSGRSRADLLALAAENLLRADRMLVGLRDLMRAAGPRVDARPVDALAVVEDVIAEIKSSQASGSHLTITVSGIESLVWTEPALLAHVFRNLMCNAVEHNKGRKDLEIEVGEDATGGERTSFVRDNGIGIAPGIAARVFEPFRRGLNSDGEGLGLGLALVEGIVANAGGSVWLDRNWVHGAAFRFTFPSAPME